MIRIGVAQIDVKIGDREANYRRVEKWMEEYYTPSATETVVILPEIWDVGYAIEEPKKYGDPDAKQAIEFLGSLAKKYNVWFAGGSVLAQTAEGAFNRALVINPKGEYVNHYDKAHLIPLMDEDKYLKDGKRECLFDVAGLTAGCVICYDLRFCEWLRLYALHGAKVLFISAEWPTIRIDHWRALLKARAIENMMYVVACNRVGNSKNTEFGGHSVILDPWGEIVYEAGKNEAGAFIEINPEQVQQIRDHLKVFEVRHPELYKE
ncbi:MAG: carbon-nitrogen family hydrolase [Synergistaceae bacterium]|nr:carbon-nitrogen family hydrolase [Synergistaceae bacterium]